MTQLKELQDSVSKLQHERGRLAVEIPKTREEIVDCVTREKNPDTLLSHLARLETFERVVADAIPGLTTRVNILQNSAKEEEQRKFREGGFKEVQRLRGIARRGKLLQTDSWGNKLVLCAGEEVLVVPSNEPDRIVSWGKLNGETYKKNLAKVRDKLIQIS